ncbi:hypothetical protein [Clostridium butyricum]|uniref:hypothetical protein n=1 Tax=Clostridium butyricum TaxID=1492 RepID=UPI00325C256E
MLGGEEINYKLTNEETGNVTNNKSFSVLKASYTYLPNKHGSFTGCEVIFNTSANKYCSIMTAKHHNATIQNFVIKPNVEQIHNTAYRNSMIYIYAIAIM